MCCTGARKTNQPPARAHRPDDALLSVSSKRLTPQTLGGGVPADVAAAVARLCLAMHRDVEAASARFFAELRRSAPTTPRSYLDLLELYQSLLTERRCVAPG
jgi:dynein heavy chain